MDDLHGNILITDWIYGESSNLEEEDAAKRGSPSRLPDDAAGHGRPARGPHPGNLLRTDEGKLWDLGLGPDNGDHQRPRTPSSTTSLTSWRRTTSGFPRTWSLGFIPSGKELAIDDQGWSGPQGIQEPPQGGGAKGINARTCQGGSVHPGDLREHLSDPPLRTSCAFSV